MHVPCQTRHYAAITGLIFTLIMGAQGAHADAQQNVQSVAALRALTPPTVATMTYVQAYYPPGTTAPANTPGADLGGGPFRWSATSTATDDACSVIKPTSLTTTAPGRWHRIWTTPYILVQDCGAKGTYGSSFGSTLPNWGIFDDGPAIRRAIAIGLERDRAEIKFPSPAGGGTYLIQSLDPSKLGAIVIGTGNRDKHNTVDLVGESLNAEGAWSGGVNIHLGDNLNRPLIYIRPHAGNPTLRRLRLDGNRENQTGYRDPTAGNKLYTVVVADTTADRPVESSIHIEDCYLVRGFNGNLYQGNNRGTLRTKDMWSVYSGQNTTDASVYITAYDSIQINPLIGSNTGYGLYYAYGTQHQVIDGAIWMNHVGEYVNSHVQFIQHKGTNYQLNKTNAIQTVGFNPYEMNGAKTWINPVFEGNSDAGNGLYSDLLITNDDSVSISHPDFAGPNFGFGSNSLPKYHIEIVGPNSNVAVSLPRYRPGKSSVWGLTNKWLTTDAAESTLALAGTQKGAHIGMVNDYAMGTAFPFYFNYSNLYGGNLVINGPATNNRSMSYRTKDVLRWDLGVSNGESGSNNTGSDFYINAYTNTGAYLSTPLMINRAKGNVIIKDLTLSSDPPASSTSACTQGQIQWDGNNIYVCVAANRWKRAALTNF